MPDGLDRTHRSVGRGWRCASRSAPSGLQVL